MTVPRRPRTIAAHSEALAFPVAGVAQLVEQLICNQ